LSEGIVSNLERSEGDVIEWRVPAGFQGLKIQKLLYQPEAAGDFYLLLFNAVLWKKAFGLRLTLIGLSKIQNNPSANNDKGCTGKVKSNPKFGPHRSLASYPSVCEREEI